MPRTDLELHHVVIYKRSDRYTAFPVLHALDSGARLLVGVWPRPHPSHYGVGIDPNERRLLVSRNGGDTWEPNDDPDAPAAWEGVPFGAMTAELSSGRQVAVWTGNWDDWPASRRAEAEGLRRGVYPHPTDDDRIVVGNTSIYVRRREQPGEPWQEREYIVPEAAYIQGFTRSGVLLADGQTLLFWLREGDQPRYQRQAHVFRSADGGLTWRLRSFPQDIFARTGDETVLLEVAPGQILAMMRNANTPGGGGHLMESWSDDAGLTWSRPLQTPIRGYPAHLLRLSDGRILCSYGYRFPPMGVRACFSEDDGNTWDIEHEVVLRNDGGTPSSLRSDGDGRSAGGGGDLGYPMSAELPDGSIFTLYYITTPDGVTHAAGTRWRA
ncbi:MAG: hypothetical protein CL878_13445 [Dehalococcoidia bacterium]|nr:hypothetical protein [Dehalococcoidia bacterium]